MRLTLDPRAKLLILALINVFIVTSPDLLTEAAVVLNSGYSVLNSDCSVLNSDYSVLNSDCSVLNSDCSVLNSDCSVLNSDCSVPNRTHSRKAIIKRGFETASHKHFIKAGLL
jgi:hypothetical protein